MIERELLDPPHSELQFSEQSLRQIQFERNKHALLRATMGNQFDIIIAVLKITMNSSSSESEKDNRVRERIQSELNQMGNVIDLSKHEYYFERREINPYDEAKFDELIIYGVDFMNTKRIKMMFCFCDVKLVWLDDSHCKVKFEDEEKALQAVRKNQRKSQINQSQIEKSELTQKSWIQLEPYSEVTFERRLFCRYASKSENKGILKSDKFSKYVEAKKKFIDKVYNQIKPELKRLMIDYGFISANQRNKKSHQRHKVYNNTNNINKNQRNFYKRKNQSKDIEQIQSLKNQNPKDSDEKQKKSQLIEYSFQSSVKSSGENEQANISYSFESIQNSKYLAKNNVQEISFVEEDPQKLMQQVEISCQKKSNLQFSIEKSLEQKQSEFDNSLSFEGPLSHEMSKNLNISFSYFDDKQSLSQLCSKK